MAQTDSTPSPEQGRRPGFSRLTVLYAWLRLIRWAASPDEAGREPRPPSGEQQD